MKFRKLFPPPAIISACGTLLLFTVGGIIIYTNQAEAPTPSTVSGQIVWETTNNDKRVISLGTHIAGGYRSITSKLFGKDTDALDLLLNIDDRIIAQAFPDPDIEWAYSGLDPRNIVAVNVDSPVETFGLSGPIDNYMMGTNAEGEPAVLFTMETPTLGKHVFATSDIPGMEAWLSRMYDPHIVIDTSGSPNSVYHPFSLEDITQVTEPKMLGSEKSAVEDGFLIGHISGIETFQSWNVSKNEGDTGAYIGFRDGKNSYLLKVESRGETLQQLLPGGDWKVTLPPNSDPDNFQYTVTPADFSPL